MEIQGRGGDGGQVAGAYVVTTVSSGTTKGTTNYNTIGYSSGSNINKGTTSTTTTQVTTNVPGRPGSIGGTALDT
jgi:hypothetical protein